MMLMMMLLMMMVMLHHIDNNDVLMMMIHHVDNNFMLLTMILLQLLKIPSILGNLCALSGLWLPSNNTASMIRSFVVFVT